MSWCHRHHRHGPHHQRNKQPINPKILPIKNKQKHKNEEPKPAESAKPAEATTTTTTSTSTTKTSSLKTTTKSTTTTKDDYDDDDGNARVVKKIHSEPYDSTRGSPTDPEVAKKRDFVRNMMKHAWDGYRLRAWGYNEVKPDTGAPSTSNIFGRAKTGATIIDSLDTLWIMGLKDEFKEGREWVAEEFNLKSSTQSLSAFETVIRFLGGLMGAYRMSGDYVFVEKAIDVAKAIDPGFDQGPLPAGLYYFVIISIFIYSR